MKTCHIITVLSIATFLFGSYAFGQDLEIKAHVDRTRLHVNDRLTLTIELSGEDARKAEQPELPDMQGFLRYIGSGGTSQNISIVNGKMSASKSFTFYYMAARKGTFTIPEIVANYKSHSVKSDPIPITITRQSEQRPSSSTQNSGLEGNLMVRALVDKKQVYQHEPIHITYRIYARVNVTSYGISKLPELTGFWSEEFDMPSRPQTRNEVINGKQYTVADIRRTAVFPTSSGKKVIGPLVLDCEIRVSRQSGQDVFDSFFDDPFFGRTVRKTISTQPVEITVKPLPQENQPLDFSGAVGEYRLDAGIDKKEVKTDEAVTLKLSLSGTGNIKMLPVPKPDFPVDFEQYDPKVTQTVNRSGNRITGTKSVEYVLIPRFPGEQRIPPVKYSFFNPKTETYETLMSPEFTVLVKPSDDKYSAPVSGLSKEEVKLLGKDIHFIKMQSDSFRRLGYRFYKSTLFIILAFLPLLGVAVAAGYKRNRDKLSRNYAYARRKKANAMAMKRLSRAKALLSVEKQKEFYAEISNALYGFAADKLNKEQAGLISSDIEKEFKQRSVDEDLIKEFFNILKTCDFMRFAPANSTQEDMNRFYQSAKDIIIKLEKEL